MAASVVRVEKNNTFTGTGFICYYAQGRCLVMTAAKAVGNRRSDYSIGLPNQGAATHQAKLLKVHKGANLALLSFVPPHPCAALEFADWRTDLSSGPVIVRGYYDMGQGAILQEPGVFRGDIRGNAVDQGTLGCDYTAGEGLIGAPVIQNNQVIGVHNRSEGTIQIVTPVTSVFSAVSGWHRGAVVASIPDMLEMIAADNP